MHGCGRPKTTRRKHDPSQVEPEAPSVLLADDMEDATKSNFFIAAIMKRPWHAYGLLRFSVSRPIHSHQARRLRCTSPPSSL